MKIFRFIFFVLIFTELLTIVSWFLLDISIELNQLLAIIVTVVLAVIYFRFKDFLIIGVIVALILGSLNLVSFTPFQLSIGLSKNFHLQIYSCILLLIILFTKLKQPSAD